MRLLFVAFGQSIHTIKWVKHFADSGNKVMLASFYPTPQIENVEIRYIPCSNKNLAFLKTWKIKKLIREFSPDILHAHYASSCGLVGALTGFHPFVLSVWGDDILEFPCKSPIHRFTVMNTIMRADYVTATSNMIANKTVDLIEHRKEVRVIPFGVDLDRFKPAQKSSRDNIVIGTARGFTLKYGLEYLIRAFARLKKSYPQIELVLIGDGPLFPAMKDLAKSLGVSETVTFAGAIPNDEVAVRMREFDIFVMPSVGEGDIFGVAAVEAMATGLPVVATRVGGLPEVVDDGKTGKIVEPADVDSLVRGLESYILSETLRIEHGKQGRVKAEQNYNWLQNAGMMESLYRLIIEKKRKNI